MTSPTRALRALALATLFVNSLDAASDRDPAGSAAPRPIQTRDGRFELRADGSWTLARPGYPSIRRARLVIAGAGWSGSVAQESGAPVPGYPRLEGSTRLFRSTLREPVAGVDWTLDQRVAPDGNGAVTLEYLLVPSRDCSISEICLFLDLPVAEWSGAPLSLWPSDSGSFPERPPARRHFLSGPARLVALGPEGASRLGLHFEDATLCTAQDGREMRSDCYQLYPRVPSGHAVRAGQVYRLKMRIVPGDDAPADVPRLTLRRDGEARIGDPASCPSVVPQFSRFEIDFDAGGTWDNPYDPDQVAIDLIVRGPDGAEHVVPAFYLQDYERAAMGDTELLIPDGPPRWRARFSPPLPGAYRWGLRMINRGKVIPGPERGFDCSPGGGARARGHLRVSGRNPRYLEFDDGTPFVALGMNIATFSANLAQAQGWYERFARAGGNFARSWWCAGLTDIESAASGRSDEGPGRYRQRDCWRIDRLVELCERLGIRLMCCIETQQNLRRDAWWERFTYNRANGGPLGAPADLFTDPEARRLFRARLRYIVARWSYSTAIGSWQFWNEVSACNDFRPGPVAEWHRDMARHLRSIDPARHIIHTNFGNLDGYPEIDGLREMELVSTNIYSRRDMAQTGAWATVSLSARYPDKPFLLTEYGVGHHGGWVGEDPDGIIVHNGLWGPLLNGSAGTGMPWGWDHWIDALDLYRFWKPIAALVDGVPFSRRDWRPARVESFRFRDPKRAPEHATVFFEGWPRNYSFTLCASGQPALYEIAPDGTLPDEDRLQGLLRGGERQRFHCRFPVDGEFVVHVPEISETGAPSLLVKIDGNETLRRALPRDEKGRPWEYWRAFAAPVAAGEHSITVANAGSGTLWTAYELRRFRRREGPDLDVEGMLCDDHILLWLRNPEHIWLCLRQGRKPQTRPEGSLALSGVADGRYAIRWIDTLTGAPIASAELAACGGRLFIPTPAIARSAAAKAVRLHDTPSDAP